MKLNEKLKSKKLNKLDPQPETKTKLKLIS